MIHVNTSYFECVFASFSSIVEGSAEFPCNNETLHICRLNTSSVVLKSFFFFGFKASFCCEMDFGIPWIFLGIPNQNNSGSKNLEISSL